MAKCIFSCSKEIYGVQEGNGGRLMCFLTGVMRITQKIIAIFALVKGARIEIQLAGGELWLTH